MSTNSWPTSWILDRKIWCCSTLWWPVWFNLPFTWCKSPSFYLAKEHNKASSLLYSQWDTGKCTSSLLIHPPIWLKILNFNLSVQRTLFHCSIVQSLCVLARWRLSILFCSFNNGFLTGILPYRPASQSFLKVDVDSFFQNIGSIV